MQFAGSSSTGGRRRRRLVVHRDGSGPGSPPIDGDGGEIESTLVASAAAAPWVPVTELRIWIYASLIFLSLSLLSLAFVRPISTVGELNRVANQLLSGSRPKILVVTEVLFLGLSTQLSLLISWYRSRCTLDFGGRYRIWPWVVALLALATFCAATNLHLTLGEIGASNEWLPWRGETVAWALPLCLLGLPIGLLLDRDVRNSRSSLCMLRLSGGTWLTSALIELYRPELQSRDGFEFVRQLLPVYAAATLFVGLWLHARIVAYVCPDPPKLEERSVWSLSIAAFRWFSKHFLDWKSVPAAAAVVAEEEVAKPKRRRKKVETEEAEAEATVVKRKRKAPARRTTTRSRVKPRQPQLEFAESEEIVDETPYDESEAMNESYEESHSDESNSSAEVEADEWNQEPENESSDSSHQSTQVAGGFTEVHQRHSSPMQAPHSRQWQPDPEPEREPEPVYNETSDSSEDGDEERQYSEDSESTSDQFKGLSKRQKRELKKQQRERDRTRGR